ncbi:MAG: molecular chaperone DnaJ [Alphaproteobacteria bacterium]|nr:molecular chaperone DnaJ [Alphaproteobacteria bacterium]
MATFKLILTVLAFTSVFMLWPRVVRRRRQARGTMSVDDAATLLEVDSFADEATIKAAHRRAIKHAHPDTGGSAAAAARINLARDTLLAYHRRHES